MLKAVVTHQGASLVRVNLVGAEEGTSEEGHVEVAKDQPNPITPELKELAWGAGSFVVFALLMRYYLFPRLKSGMDARYHGIQRDHEQAEQVKAAAQREVADYQAALASVRAEAATHVDRARQTLESERTAALAEANGRINAKRSAALDQAAAARDAVRDQIESAVASVAARTTELAIGKAPAADAVARVVGAQSKAGAN